MGNTNHNDIRNIYSKIRDIKEDSTLDESIIQEMETLPATADTLAKPMLIKKLVIMTKFPKELLRKYDDAQLRMIYDGLMSIGKAKVLKALKGEKLED